MTLAPLDVVRASRVDFVHVTSRVPTMLTHRRSVNDDDLATHEALDVLHQLLPEGIAAGGSFATWLPHPLTLAGQDRATMFASARERAVNQCIRMLLLRAGLNQDSPVPRTDKGPRDWPSGFCGSLTHKGTLVLGVIAASSKITMIGIDLDRRDRGRSELTAVQNMVAPEGLPADIDPERGMLLSFCAKEAVFKAQYPVTRRPLNFSDVRLAWVGSRDILRATVTSPGAGLVVRAALVGDWVIAVALAALELPG